MELVGVGVWLCWLFELWGGGGGWLVGFLIVLVV